MVPELMTQGDIDQHTETNEVPNAFNLAAIRPDCLPQIFMMPSFLAAVAPVYFLPLRKSTDPPLALDFDTLGDIFSGTRCVLCRPMLRPV